MQSFSIVFSLVNGLGLMALVAVLYGTIQRLPIGRFARSCLHGVFFAFGAVASMVSPAVLLDGVIIDARTIMVGLAGAFAGPPAGVIAALAAGAYRIWLGGAGTPVGLGTLMVALTAGLAWRTFWYQRKGVSPFGLLLLGLGIASQVLLMPFLPFPLTLDFALKFTMSLTLASLLATQVLGALMERENRQIARESALAGHAFTDPLTGLANRRAIDRRKALLKESAPEGGYTVLAIDIDHFKTVNDQHGHSVGDTVLCIIANMLKDSVRSDTFVARLGGEEFIIILPATPPDGGWSIAERVRRRVGDQPIAFADARLRVTISIGIASSGGRQTLDEVLEAADAALYLAKHGGRNRVVLAGQATTEHYRLASSRLASSGRPVAAISRSAVAT